MTIKERIENYERERKLAVERIERMFQSSGIKVLPLSDVIQLLPKIPEWDRYCRKRRRKTHSPCNLQKDLLDIARETFIFVFFHGEKNYKSFTIL